MNNNNEGTRSFEPVNATPPAPKKNKKPDAKKLVTVAIFAVAVAILVLFCAIIITEIVYKVNGEPTDKANGNIKYTTTKVASSDVNRGELMIVNKTYPLLNKDASGKVVNVYNYNSSLKEDNANLVIQYKFLDSAKISLLPEIIVAFNNMTSALAQETGNSDILLAYGYLEPKESTLECDYPHELGTTVDIKLINENGTYPMTGNQTVLNWLNTNAAKYGFVNSDPSGSLGHGTDEKVASTQFRYVGSAHATYISANNLSLDTYIEALKNSHNSTESALEIKAADGNSYAVYYVSASAEQYTEIKVPENYNYTISGDNIGGFIVTINLSQKVS